MSIKEVIVFLGFMAVIAVFLRVSMLERNIQPLPKTDRVGPYFDAYAILPDVVEVRTSDIGMVNPNFRADTDVTGIRSKKLMGYDGDLAVWHIKTEISADKAAGRMMLQNSIRHGVSTIPYDPNLWEDS